MQFRLALFQWATFTWLVKGAISLGTHGTHFDGKHFLSSFVHSVWDLFSTCLFHRFPFVFRAAHNARSLKCVVNPISYAWRWINCLFSIPSLLTLTHYVSLAKRKINKCEKCWWNVARAKRDGDETEQKIRLVLHFINVVATNYVHIEFEQSSFISTEIIDSMPSVEGKKKLFFALCSRRYNLSIWRFSINVHHGLSFKVDALAEWIEWASERTKYRQSWFS